MLLMEAVLKQYKTFQVNEIMTSTKKLRNTSLVRDDHQTYVKKIVKSFRNSPKRFYGYVRSLQMSKVQVTELISPDGSLTTNDKTSANYYARHLKKFLQ